MLNDEYDSKISQQTDRFEARWGKCMASQIKMPYFDDGKNIWQANMHNFDDLNQAQKSTALVTSIHPEVKTYSP